MKKYKNPTPTVDIIIEIIENNLEKIVVIKRKNPPHGYALPGGFVDEGEPLWNAAIREAKEETSLDVEIYKQFFIYSDPSRDKRQHTVSTVFIGKACGTPKGEDDALEAILVDPNNLPALVFDHKLIVEDYLKFKKSGVLPPWNR
jgi:8-oxo-dGTP diphosphatase